MLLSEETVKSAEVGAALLQLNEWYRQEALKTLRIDHRAWMESLGGDELRLLWYAGQKDASFLSIGKALGWSALEVKTRVIGLRRKLGAQKQRLTRQEFDQLTKTVARYGGTTTLREPSGNHQDS